MRAAAQEVVSRELARVRAMPRECEVNAERMIGLGRERSAFNVERRLVSDHILVIRHPDPAIIESRALDWHHDLSSEEAGADAEPCRFARVTITNQCIDRAQLLAV